MKTKRLTIAAAVLCLLPTVAWGVPIHVYPGDSIQEALDSASSGDLVLVHVEPYASWTWEEAITLYSGVDLKSVEGSDYTFIDARSVTPPAAAAVEAGGKHDLEFGAAGQGFTVRGGTTYGLDLMHASNMDVVDINVQTEASWAGIMCNV
jgi:hypothetical protein